MKEKLTAIFDIGKTNKKFFLFNRAFKEVYREYTSIELTEDEDGHPTDNLSALQRWLGETFEKILKSEKYHIEAINFSSYGASFVHLNAQGQVVAPLYNYTKPYDSELLKDFYDRYGPEAKFCETTGSTTSGMLNSGMQLYWLKNRRPDTFKQVRYSLHLPQYLSYLFTGIPISDFTSIGCHTALWDYTIGDYHGWVYQEGLDGLLAPVVSTETSINMAYKGQNKIRIGVGIHDSSAALIPYIRSIKKPFVLLSTGTWSVSLNPFSDNPAAGTKEGCINYMQINGQQVRAARLFLGNEYNLQVKELSEQYQVNPESHQAVTYQPEIHRKIMAANQPRIAWKSLSVPDSPAETQWDHSDFETAYHQLMYELAALQAESVRQAVGNSEIKRLYIDGGFTDNQVFLEMLGKALPSMKIRTTKSSLGSALGAAIVISGKWLTPDFLKENYDLRKHVPKILT
jgi:sugar (pentulose or hexulose) kinase